MSKIKDHLNRHQKTYILAGGILTGAVVTGAIICKVRPTVVSVEGGSTVNTIKGVVNVNPSIVNFIERSTPSKPVHLEGTNLFFNSLSEAARETGHSLSMISRQVNGHIPDVKGDVFTILESAS